MRIGILTGGGDCPGLNALIRAVVRKGIGEYDDEVVGFRDGWRGVLEGDTVDMDLHAVLGIRHPLALERVSVDLRPAGDQFAHLVNVGIAFLKRDRGRQRGPDPQVALLEFRQKFQSQEMDGDAGHQDQRRRS